MVVSCFFFLPIQCSATCGQGIKSRSVSCSSTDEAECKSNEKPPHQTICDAGPCAMALSSSAAGSWILSDWSQVRVELL